MKLLKFFRKSSFIILSSILIFIVSCTQYDTDNKLAFDYEAFETFKNPEFKVEIPETILNSSETREKYEQINGIINEKLGSKLSITQLDNKYLDNLNNKISQRLYENEFLSSNDKYLLKEFNQDLEQFDLQTTLDNFEKNVLSLNLDEIEFQKYNKFANVIMLIENQEPGFFSTDSNKFSRVRDACGEAITSYTIATLGLITCGIVPILCVIAIANKIRTFRNMVLACKNKK